MKLARTIRFDPSDLNVFPIAAEEGEWAVVGTFCFAGMPPSDLTGKVKQAFSNGFLGCQSFGFSTLVSVVRARPKDIQTITDHLANHFVEKFGAPSKAAASNAKRYNEYMLYVYSRNMICICIYIYYTFVCVDY